MEKLLIKGGNSLSGKISCSGAKNAALFAVSLLANSDKKILTKLNDWRKALTNAVKNHPK